MSGSLSVAKIPGYVFFLMCFLYYNPFFSRRSLPHPPKALWWFLGYLFVYALNFILIPTELLGSFFGRFLTLLQLIIFFWFCSNLLEDERMARNVLLMFSISSVLLAASALIGAFESGVDVTQGSVSALEYNPATLGVLMASAALTLIGLQLAASFKGLSSKITLLALTLPPVAMMVSTGGRGALVVFITGCLVYVLPMWPSKWTLRNILIVLGVLVAALYIVFSNPFYLERWNKAYYDADSSGRERIYPASIGMILERPMFGWGPVLHWHELGARTGRLERDEHNLFLHLLAEVGLVGAVPFLVGVWLCVRAAWKTRSANLGSLPFALIVASLVSNITDTYITRKVLWLLLALAVAAAHSAVQKKVILFKTAKAD